MSVESFLTTKFGYFLSCCMNCNTKCYKKAFYEAFILEVVFMHVFLQCINQRLLLLLAVSVIRRPRQASFLNALLAHLQRMHRCSCLTLVFRPYCNGLPQCACNFSDGHVWCVVFVDISSTFMWILRGSNRSFLALNGGQLQPTLSRPVMVVFNPVHDLFKLVVAALSSLEFVSTKIRKENLVLLLSSDVLVMAWCQNSVHVSVIIVG